MPGAMNQPRCLLWHDFKAHPSRGWKYAAWWQWFKMSDVQDVSEFHVLKVLTVFKIPCVELGNLQKIWWRLNLSCLKDDDFWNLTQPLTLVCYNSVEVAEWSIAGKLQKVWPHLPSSILAVSEELVTNYGKIFNFGWWLPQTKVDGQGWYSTFFYICSPWLTPD